MWVRPTYLLIYQSTDARPLTTPARRGEIQTDEIDAPDSALLGDETSMDSRGRLRMTDVLPTDRGLRLVVNFHEAVVPDSGLLTLTCSRGCL